MALSSKQVFVIMKVTGTASAPVWSKVGKGRFSQEKAEKEADKLAKATPGARFYVMATIRGFMKRPEVCSKSYKAAS